MAKNSYINHPKMTDRIHSLELQVALQQAEIQALSLEIQQLALELSKLQQKQALDSK